MTRATGMLVGVLLMSGLFLLALSADYSPAFIKEIVHSEAAENLPETGVAPVQDEPVEPRVDTPEAVVTDTAAPAVHNTSVSTGKEPLLDPQRWNQSIEAHEPGSREVAAAVSHYQVWSPFRSEWAANGFAQRLARATDVPMEVIHESPEQYQVVFSYQDDGERQALVERIETITGLELE